MKVLKFGGTSVSNENSIDFVSEIIKKDPNKLTVVVSALGGVTDILSDMIKKASIGELNYKNEISDLELRHTNLIKNRLPLDQQGSMIMCNLDLESFIALEYFY